MTDLLSSIVAWALREERIRAVVVTGSDARMDGRRDEWSDLDVQIVMTDARRYLKNDGWLKELGDVWISFAPDSSDPYRLVWFKGGKKVDFSFLPIAYVADQAESGLLCDEYRRGYRVELDKDGLFDDVPESPYLFPQPEPPTQEDFQATVDEFWFEAIHVAQFLRRREMWVVRFRDWTMKTDMLQMLEWHARIVNRASNTWTIGRRISEWTEAQSLAALGHVWAGWDVEESWQALQESMALFGRLSDGVASALQFRYSRAVYQEISEYIHELYAERDPK